MKPCPCHKTLLSGLLAGVLFLPLLINSALHTRSDAVFHLAITRAILREGIPPANPLLAGVKTHYYWFYHALVAGLNKICSVDPAVLMACLNFFSLFILLTMVYRIVIRLSPAGEKNKNGLLGMILVAFGLNGWGWILFLANVLKDPGLLPGILTGGVWSFLPKIVLTRWEGTMGFMATKFLVATPFSLSLTAVTVGFYTLLRFRERPGIKWGLLFVIFTLLGSFLNLFTGAVFLFICGSFFFFRLSASLLRRDLNRRTSLYGFLLCILVLLLLSPYAINLSETPSVLGRSVCFGIPHLFRLRVLAVILLPLWILAAITWRKNRENKPQTGKTLIYAGIILIAGGFLFVSFANQQFKLPFLLAIFLSLLIGINVSSLSLKTARLIWLVALTTVPTTLLGLIAYSCQPPQFQPSSEEVAIYSWIRKNLPENTVLIAEKNMDGCLLLTHRDSYLACSHYLKTNPEDRKIIRKRRRLLWELWHGKEPQQAAEKIRIAVGRPLAVLTYSSPVKLGPGFRILYSRSNLTLWAGDGISEGFLPLPSLSEGDKDQREPGQESNP